MLDNHGNVWALLKFRIDSCDIVLQEHLTTAARNATYTSSTIQNQLIDIPWPSGAMLPFSNFHFHFEIPISNSICILHFHVSHLFVPACVKEIPSWILGVCIAVGNKVEGP